MFHFTVPALKNSQKGRNLHLTKVQNRLKVTEKWEMQRNFFRWFFVKRLLWFQFSLLFLCVLIKNEDVKRAKKVMGMKGKIFRDLFRKLKTIKSCNRCKWSTVDIKYNYSPTHKILLYLTAWQEAKASKDVS